MGVLTNTERPRTFPGDTAGVGPGPSRFRAEMSQWPFRLRALFLVENWSRGRSRDSAECRPVVVRLTVTSHYEFGWSRTNLIGARRKSGHAASEVIGIQLGLASANARHVWSGRAIKHWIPKTAPPTSSWAESPIIRQSAGSMPSESAASWKIRGSGFTNPTS